LCSIKNKIQVALKKSGDVRSEFYANIQSKKIKDGRKVIELPPHIRTKFKVGDSVRVIIELM